MRIPPPMVVAGGSSDKNRNASGTAARGSIYPRIAACCAMTWRNALKYSSGAIVECTSPPVIRRRTVRIVR